MNLKDKINEDLKTAMKEKDAVKLQTIRSIRAMILEFEKSGSGKEIAPEDEIKMLSQAAKKRQESIEQFRNAGRNELADKEEAELKIIQLYLPKQLSEEEIESEVRRIAEEVGAVSKNDFAKVMPVAAKEMKGKADGRTIKLIVEKVLGNNWFI